MDWPVDEVPADPVCRKRLAATLVQHSVLHWEHLDSIDPESLQVQHPTQAALLRRATAQATWCGRNERPMHQDRGLAGAQLSSSACSSTVDARHKSAIAVAGEMSQNMVTQAHEKWSMEIHQICRDVFGSGPKKTVQKLAAAGQDAEVTRLLEERARFLRVECKKGSLSSVASGLHAWHAFATDILGYSESETLPPKQDVDVSKFLAIFRNPGTAANYVGYVKGACTHLSMVTSWWSPTVTLTLKGMRAEHLRAAGGPALAKVLLTDEWVAQLARLSLAMNQPHVHAAVLVSSVFLLRVQGEAMGLEVGMKRDPRCCRQVDTALSGLSHAKEALTPSTSGCPEGNTDPKAACWCVLASAPERPRTSAPCTQCSVTRAPVRPFSTSQAPRSSTLSAAC